MLNAVPFCAFHNNPIPFDTFSTFYTLEVRTSKNPSLFHTFTPKVTMKNIVPYFLTFKPFYTLKAGMTKNVNIHGKLQSPTSYRSVNENVVLL